VLRSRQIRGACPRGTASPMRQTSFTWLVTSTMMMTVDDHATHQTLAVSIKKPISMARTFYKDALNEFTEVASSALASIIPSIHYSLGEED